MKNTTLGGRLLVILPVLAVTLASLFLLAFVGYGESSRVYPSLRLERASALGEVVKHPIDVFSQTGLSLRQFVGFKGPAKSALDIEPAIRQISLIDRFTGATVFSQSRGDRPVGGQFAPSRHKLPQADYAVLESDVAYRIDMPIRDKFEEIGTLQIDVDLELVGEPIRARFGVILIALVAVGLGFACFQLLATHWRERRAAVGTETAFAVAFAAAGAVVVVSMYQLYSQGVRDKTEALSQSIAGRLSNATELGIELGGLSGLQELLHSYTKLDPDIESIALIAGDGDILIELGRSEYSTGRGQAVNRDADDVYRYLNPLTGPTGSPTEYKVAVAIPKRVVFEKIWRHGKNFAALFLACGLLAMTFLAAGRSIGKESRVDSSTVERGMPDPEVARAEARLRTLKPAYFLAMFADALTISFLPQYAASVAGSERLALASVPFTVLFVCLSLTLVPASRFAERGSLKRLLLVGVLLVGGGLLILATGTGLGTLVAGRALSGFGQATMLIAVQTYCLAVSPPGYRTQALSIQVHGYNAAMISGAAIGGLLVAYLERSQLFAIASGVSALTAVYVALMVSDLRVNSPAPSRPVGSGTFLADMKSCLADGELLRALLLVGIVSKFVLTGVILFATPLILSEAGYVAEDIGQIVMCYAIGTLTVTNLASRFVDRSGSTTAPLAIGGLTSAVGMVLFSLAVVSGTGWVPAPESAASLLVTLEGMRGLANEMLFTSSIPYLATLVVIFGMFLVGAGHAMVAAPIVTFIADTPVAHLLGAARVTGMYRMLERLGHISGPTAASKLLVLAGTRPIGITTLGLVSLGLAGLFWMSMRRRTRGKGELGMSAHGRSGVSP